MKPMCYAGVNVALVAALLLMAFPHRLWRKDAHTHRYC
jgi:hypothetical protein